MWQEGAELLTRAECFELLGEDVIVRAWAGSKLGAALAGNVVAVQVDAADPDGDTAWTVHVVGRSEPISDRATLDNLARRSPSLGVRRDADHVVRINAQDVTGRRFAPTDQLIQDR